MIFVDSVIFFESTLMGNAPVCFLSVICSLSSVGSQIVQDIADLEIVLSIFYAIQQQHIRNSHSFQHRFCSLMYCIIIFLPVYVYLFFFPKTYILCMF